jgi:hypothetical protein
MLRSNLLCPLLGLSLLLLPLQSSAAEEDFSLTPGDVFAGAYSCGSAAYLLLHIESVTMSEVTAVFHFVYPSSTQHGAYLVRGSWDTSPSTRRLKLVPAEWIHAPKGKIVPVGLFGFVSEDGLRITGEVLHGSCGRFQVNKTRIDVAPPETTIYFPGSRGEPNAFQMPLRAIGTLLASSSSPPRDVLQMLLNGVGGIVEEARTARRTASQTQAAAAQASAGAVGDGGTMAAAQAAAHTATAAADRAQAATSPPRSLTEGEGAGAVELALA